MKKLFCLAVLSAVAMMTFSCAKSNFVVNGFSVTPSSARNGDEVVLSVDIGQESNVKEITATFCIDGAYIGETSSAPYALTYVVTGLEPGSHDVSCSVTASDRSLSISQKSSVELSATLYVRE